MFNYVIAYPVNQNINISVMVDDCMWNRLQEILNLVIHFERLLFVFVTSVLNVIESSADVEIQVVELRELLINECLKFRILFLEIDIGVLKRRVADADVYLAVHSFNPVKLLGEDVNLLIEVLNAFFPNQVFCEFGSHLHFNASTLEMIEQVSHKSGLSRTRTSEEVHYYGVLLVGHIAFKSIIILLRFVVYIFFRYKLFTNLIWLKDTAHIDYTESIINHIIQIFSFYF